MFLYLKLNNRQNDQFSWISGISLLGLVTEMYLYGTQYVFVICSLTLSGILTSYVYLPVFHDLHLESCYQVSVSSIEIGLQIADERCIDTCLDIRFGFRLLRPVRPVAHKTPNFLFSYTLQHTFITLSSYPLPPIKITWTSP